MSAKAATLTAGKPGEAGAVLASMVSEDAANKVHQLIEDAVANGAKLCAGGAIAGSIMQATVVDAVRRP